MERDTRDGKETMEDPGNVDGDRGPRNIQARIPGTAGAHTGLSNLYIWGTGRLECPVDSLTIPSPSQVESKKKTRRQMSSSKPPTF